MELKFNSAICTSMEQSERLLALGLKKDTADMVYKPHCDYHDEVINYCEPTPMVEPLRKYIIADDIDFRYYIPAWSLSRLIEILPSHNIYEDGYGEEWCRYLKVSSKLVEYDTYPLDVVQFDKCDNLYDNIIDCIEWVIKEGFFNKEYLE